MFAALRAAPSVQCKSTPALEVSHKLRLDTNHQTKSLILSLLHTLLTQFISVEYYLANLNDAECCTAVKVSNWAQGSYKV